MPPVLLKLKSRVTKKQLAIGALALAIIVVVITVVIIAASNAGKKSDKWTGIPLTEGIPAFGGEMTSLRADEGSVAAFYTDASSEAIADYVKTLKENCGVDLSGTAFPRSAVYGERLIALHYNVTERNFSVTVTKQEE